MWKLLGAQWRDNGIYIMKTIFLNWIVCISMSFEIELSDLNKNLHSIAFIVYNYKKYDYYLNWKMKQECKLQNESAI